MSEQQAAHSPTTQPTTDGASDARFDVAKRLNPPMPLRRTIVYAARFFLKMTSLRVAGPIMGLAYATGSQFLLALAAATTNAAIILSWTWEVDHYEEEPWRLVATTLLWGAIPAIALAAFGEVIFHNFGGYLLGTAPARPLQVGVVAPIVEEICKGVVLVFLFRRHRHEFDGMVDGLLYGALVGIGFSMTENVVYYMQADPAQLENLIFLRGILFGMNHAVFSACFGLGLGIARDSIDPTTRRVAPFIGLLAGIALHMGHNLLVTSSSGRLAVPLGIAAALGWFYLVAQARKREARWIRTGLTSELNFRIINAAEVDAMCSAKTRAATLRHALIWETEPGPAQFAVRFYAVATELAFARHKAEIEPNDLRYRDRVAKLRQQLVALRSAYPGQVIVVPEEPTA